MNCLVTGAAGFIGSQLSETLLAEGHRVVGVDAFTDNYAAGLKRANIARGLADANFRLLEADLCSGGWEGSVGEIDWVFHLAARPGVRTSWGEDFATYCAHNILATQRLLETCVTWQPQKIVFASSSSVYGSARRLPVRESSPLRPISPYGVTKLAGEHLCRIYRTNHNLPVVALRYFTVYGPRQRPDMAFARWISALLEDQPIIFFGDGRQTRDFTFVSDVVRATLLAAQVGRPGDTYNIAGGSRTSPREVLELLTEISGRKPQVTRQPVQKGDPRHTWADTGLARQRLGFSPQVGISDGLAAQFSAAARRNSGSE